MSPPTPESKIPIGALFIPARLVSIRADGSDGTLTACRFTVRSHSGDGRATLGDDPDDRGPHAQSSALSRLSWSQDSSS
ncbi:hypothetical protein GCM10009625_25790 [Brachybacterium fresconis]